MGLKNGVPKGTGSTSTGKDVQAPADAVTKPRK